MAAVVTLTQFEYTPADVSPVSLDGQLWLLGQLAQLLSDAIAKSPPAVFFSQQVQQLVQQVQRVERQDRAEVLRDLVAGGEARLSYRYRTLNRDMKLVFWCRMGPTLCPYLDLEPLCKDEQDYLYKIVNSFARMDSNQQFHWLRKLLETQNVQ